MAGGSSVAAVGAVTVEGAPRLSASTSMFTVTRRAPERQTERDRDRERERKPQCLSKVSLKSFLEDVDMKRNNRPSAHLIVLVSRCVGGT